MPFLVDSVAGAIASRGLIVHRLLHPVVCVERDEKGCLTSVGPLCDEAEKRESIMYLEIDRTDARGRQRLVGELHRVLADVRAAVFDWKALQAKIRADADAIADAEGAALLNCLAAGALPLLGLHSEKPPPAPTDPP